MDFETYALSKKYTDKKVSESGGGSGSFEILDNSIGAEKLKKDIQDSIKNAGDHINNIIPSEEGSHSLRYYRGTLEYNDNGTWKPLNISNLII